MTPKEQRFCEEYLVDLNATQAAIRSGYSQDSAGAIGWENLKKPYIQEEISALRAKLSAATGLSQEWVLNRFKLISDRCVQAVPVMKFDPIEKAMVQETAVDPETGEEVGVYTFDSSGANKATEMIGKHLGFFEKDNEQQKQQPQTIIIGGKEVTF